MANIVVMAKIPEEIVTVDDFPEGFTPEVLGSPEEVMSLIQSVYPFLTYSDVYMNMDNNPVHSVGIRNPKDEVIKAFYDKLGWRAYDPSLARVFPPFDGSDS